MNSASTPLVGIGVPIALAVGGVVADCQVLISIDYAFDASLGPGGSGFH